MTSVTPSFLRRYTDLPALLHLLSTKKLTLLDPKTWDDSNDSHYLSLYKQKKNCKTVLALCFSQAAETYHHWRVFSGSSSGICVLFDRQPLLKALQSEVGVQVGEVNYLTLSKARRRKPKTEELPFIKRFAFIDESEYRVVFESADEVLPSKPIPVSLASIRSISLSPWLHESLAQATKDAIHSIDGCSRLKVFRSTLVSNEEWKAIGGNAA